MHFEPLGDQAVIARCVTEAEAATFAETVRQAGLAWVVDVVAAYTSVAVFYEPWSMTYAAAEHALIEVPPSNATLVHGRSVTIPCCYELGPDLVDVARHAGLTEAEVIEMHAGRPYTVYAIGFCPGFPYLGYLPEALAGIPRRPSPRARVPAGSIGLTGRQTGIYTEPRPGGWNLVGRTPLSLVDLAREYFPLRVGDTVAFAPIDRGEFESRVGERLPE